MPTRFFPIIVLALLLAAPPARAGVDVPAVFSCNSTAFTRFYASTSGRTYALTRSPLSWEEARALAAGNAGRLAQFPDAATDAEVAGRLAPFFAGSLPDRAWIGLYDPQHVGGWCDGTAPCTPFPGRFVAGDGGIVPFANWAPGEPDNLCPPTERTGEGCQGEGYAAVDGLGLWHDEGPHRGTILLSGLVEWTQLLSCVDAKLQPTTLDQDSGIMNSAALTGGQLFCRATNPDGTPGSVTLCAKASDGGSLCQDHAGICNEAPLSCRPGTSLNPATGKCEGAPSVVDPFCPPGTVADGAGNCAGAVLAPALVTGRVYCELRPGLPGVSVSPSGLSISLRPQTCMLVSESGLSAPVVRPPTSSDAVAVVFSCNGTVTYWRGGGSMTTFCPTNDLVLWGAMAYDPDALASGGRVTCPSAAFPVAGSATVKDGQYWLCPYFGVTPQTIGAFPAGAATYRILGLGVPFLAPFPSAPVPAVCPAGAAREGNRCLVPAPDPVDPSCPVTGVFSAKRGVCYLATRTCPLGPYPCRTLAADTPDSVGVPGANLPAYCSPAPCSADTATFLATDDTKTGVNDKKPDGEVKDGKCLGTIYLFNGTDSRCVKEDLVTMIVAIEKIAVAATATAAGLGPMVTFALMASNTLATDAASGNLGMGTAVNIGISAATAAASAYLQGSPTVISGAGTTPNGATNVATGTFSSGPLAGDTLTTYSVSNPVTGTVTNYGQLYDPVTNQTITQAVSVTPTALQHAVDAAAAAAGPATQGAMEGTFSPGHCCWPDSISPMCSTAEVQEWSKRKNGQCHLIGTYCSKKWPLGLADVCVQTKETSCCFNSQLGRIFHEQGRPQLQSFTAGACEKPGACRAKCGDRADKAKRYECLIACLDSCVAWGDPKHPNCRGFTPEEFSRLRIDEFDLDEYLDSFRARLADGIGADGKINDYLTNIGKGKAESVQQQLRQQYPPPQ